MFVCSWTMRAALCMQPQGTPSPLPPWASQAAGSPPAAFAYLRGGGRHNINADLSRRTNGHGCTNGLPSRLDRAALRSPSHVAPRPKRRHPKLTRRIVLDDGTRIMTLRDAADLFAERVRQPSKVGACSKSRSSCGSLPPRAPSATRSRPRPRRSNACCGRLLDAANAQRDQLGAVCLWPQARRLRSAGRSKCSG